MTNHTAKKFYNNIAEKYHWFFSSWDDVMQRQMQELTPLLQKHKVKTVLDCACGTGLQAIGLANAGFEVIGSDLSKGMLEAAEKNAGKAGISIKLIQADFKELRNRVEGEFDAVICMGNSIPHLMNKEDIAKALANIYKCVKPGGLAVFDTRNYDKMLLEKQRFLPMRINAEKDGNIVSVLYVFDYLDNIIRFNIVYLIEDKKTGGKKWKLRL